MAAVEVWTIGGGEYIVNVFNAVAAWTGAGGYKSMIQAVIVMAFAMATMVIAFDSNWRAWINWFLQATLMYMCLMVPRLDVQVVDRINPGLAPSYVANVPLGLAMMASFTSQIGDYLTTSAEVVFGLPVDQNYSANGMVYGARLLEATQNIAINDAEFAANLDEHMRQCVFYDVLLGRKSMSTLSAAPDLWAALAPGSVSRAQKFLTRDVGSGLVTSEIKTCRDAYNAMDGQWAAPSGPLDKVIGPLSRSLYPKALPDVARAKLLADLGGSYSYMTGVSAAAADILKQTLLINAMTQAMHTMAGASGASAIDVYAQTRAEIQTRNTYSAISQMATKWVPLLHIVLTVVFYALFPVIFPLFLMPRTGVPALKGYVTGFFYLAAWGPLFVILHMILMLKGASDMAAIANGSGTSLLGFAGINGVASDVSLLAGYLIASVPFLAGGLAKGAMSISSNATSFLAPSQNAAEVAAGEASTGNFGAGNTSFDTHSFNTRQANNWSTMGGYSSGASVFNTRQNDGTMTSSYPEAEVGDTSGAISRLAVSPQLSQELQSSFSKSASEAKTRSETLSNSASSSFSTANTQAADFRRALTSGDTLERSFGHSDQQTIGSAYSSIDQAATMIQNKFGYDRQASENYATEFFMNGSLNTGTGGPVSTGGGPGSPTTGGKQPGLLTGIGGAQITSGRNQRSSTGGTVSGSSGLSETRDALASFARQHNWNDQREAFDRATHNSTNGSLVSRADNVSASYSRANGVAQEARTAFDQSQRYEQAAQLRDSNGVSVGENLSQRFVDFVRREQANMPGITPAWNPTRELASTPQQLDEQAFYVRQFVKAERARVAAGIEPSLTAPSPAQLTRPSANTQSKVARLSSAGMADVDARPLPVDANVPTAAAVYATRQQRSEAVDAGGMFVGAHVDSRKAAAAKVAPHLSQVPQETLDNVKATVKITDDDGWKGVASKLVDPAPRPK